MNEPHDAVEQWPVAAQHGIDAVRDVDRARPILIEGNGWSSSYLWPRYNAKLLGLKDPADNLIYSAHVYFDNDGGGKYLKKDMTDFDPDVGIRRVEPFITWLKQHGKRGHIGEFGVPDNVRAGWQPWTGCWHGCGRNASRPVLGSRPQLGRLPAGNRAGQGQTPAAVERAAEVREARRLPGTGPALTAARQANQAAPSCSYATTCPEIGDCNHKTLGHGRSGKNLLAFSDQNVTASNSATIKTLATHKRKDAMSAIVFPHYPCALSP